MQLRVVYPAERIAVEVRRLAAEITRDSEGDDLVLVVVLQGAFIFAADLIRHIHAPLIIDFLRVASYEGTETTGSVRLLVDLQTCIKDKKVVVIEDIIDTGLTLSFILQKLREKEPKSLRVCTLIDKPARRRVPLTPDYVGMECTGGFLIGYGLDINGKKRELPAVYEIVTLPGGGLNDSTM